MDTQKLATYQNYRIELANIEKTIEERFKVLEKKQIIETDRPMDYGSRGFSLIMYFDEINIMALSPENIEGIKQLLIKYGKIRKQQSTLELELKAENKIAQQQLKSVKGFEK